MAKLILISDDSEQEFELKQFDSIGRHPENSVQLLDRIISKEHCHIRRTADHRYVLRDLGSLNGTYVQSERVINERFLCNGDEISLGTSRLRFVDDKPRSPRNMVTIAPDMSDSHIRQRFSPSEACFVPEKEITDVDTLRRDYERLRIGHVLATAVGNELDLEKLLPKILDQAFELVGADRGAILLMNDDDDLIPAYVKMRTGHDESIVVSKTVLSEVLKTRSAVLSSDAALDSRFSAAHSIIMQGIRSTMTVPLLCRDDLLGVMHIDSQIATNAFGEKDLQVCTGMATQAAIAIQNARLASRIEAEANTRAQLSRLIPPAIVEQVVKGELTIEKGGVLHDITMLYVDIRGFTAMSDGKSPKEVVNTLNEYFEVMVEVLFHHKGTLDKFVGDEIIGLFGAPLDMEDAPYKSICCALDMFHSLTEFNRTRAAENQPPIRVGIGINTGPVITGAIGSTRALQYTAIGDAMNVASRLVDLAKPGELLISAETFEYVSDRVEAQALPPVKVKGKAEAQKILRVIKLKAGLSTSPGVAPPT